MARKFNVICNKLRLPALPLASLRSTAKGLRRLVLCVYLYRGGLVYS